MRHAPRRPRTPIALTIITMLVVSACSTASPGAGGNGGSGSLYVAGSSTVLPISQRNSEKFREVEPAVEVRVDGQGTSDGFALFCDRESDISDASRPIKQAEIDTCAENGIEFIELYIAIDGISVITSPDTEDVDCLSFVDLWALLGPDAAGNGSNWSDADDAADEAAQATGGEFGESHAPYPDGTISITAPGEESGTFDSFVEIVLDPVGGALVVDDVTTTANYQASADDNVIVQGISGTPGSLGWVGFAYYEENAEALKALEIDGGDGCVSPTTETIASGEYPIARPLFIYVNAAEAAENEALASYVDFYLSDEGRASVAEVGYVDIPDEDWRATLEVWEKRTTGTQVGE